LTSNRSRSHAVEPEFQATEACSLF
jgi:hypothetical protein